MAASSVPGLRLSEPKCKHLHNQREAPLALLMYQVLFPFSWVKFCLCTGRWLGWVPTARPLPRTPVPAPPRGAPRFFSVFYFLLSLMFGSWHLPWEGAFITLGWVSDTWEPLQWQNTSKITELKRDLGWKGPLNSSSPSPATSDPTLSRTTAKTPQKHFGAI